MDLRQQIQQAIGGRYPLIYCHTPEEDRVLNTLSIIGQREFSQTQIPIWRCTQGWQGIPEWLPAQISASVHPLSALQQLLNPPQTGFYVLQDLSAFMTEAAVIRALRDLYYAHGLKSPTVHIVIISPVQVIPPDLEKNILLITVPPPNPIELQNTLEEVLQAYPALSIPSDLKTDLRFSLQGLTLNEVRHTLHHACQQPQLTPSTWLASIQNTKKSIISQNGFLEYIPPILTLEQIGGLHILKEWIAKRSQIFHQASLTANIPLPKGVLIMGISGCGKSLSAKVIAKMWGVPLFRLDMNQVFAGLYGTPEATFHRALQIAESVAPVVLWIDEIENGLGFSHQARNTSQAQIISAFLTWMQEKKQEVFVAATANNIEVLPAEMIRKGRFDQVFFCDLPDDSERAEIFAIHLRPHTPSTAEETPPLDMRRLVSITQDWNAAEIEQLVIAARIEAFHQQRAITMNDLVQLSRTIIPLSRTMSSQIKTIRDWAWNRATPASRNKGLSLPMA